VSRAIHRALVEITDAVNGTTRVKTAAVCSVHSPRFTSAEHGHEVGERIVNQTMGWLHA